MIIPVLNYNKINDIIWKEYIKLERENQRDIHGYIRQKHAKKLFALKIDFLCAFFRKGNKSLIRVRTYRIKKKHLIV